MLRLARTGALLLDSLTHTQTLNAALPTFGDTLPFIRASLLLCLLLGFPGHLRQIEMLLTGALGV